MPAAAAPQQPPSSIHRVRSCACSVTGPGVTVDQDVDGLQPNGAVAGKRQQISIRASTPPVRVPAIDSRPLSCRGCSSARNALCRGE